jgi:hypothetical protein
MPEGYFLFLICKVTAASVPGTHRTYWNKRSTFLVLNINLLKIAKYVNFKRFRMQCFFLRGYFREPCQPKTKLLLRELLPFTSAFRQREQYVILFLSLFCQPYTKFAFLFTLCQLNLHECPDTISKHFIHIYGYSHWPTFKSLVTKSLELPAIFHWART